MNQTKKILYIESNENDAKLTPSIFSRRSDLAVMVVRNLSTALKKLSSENYTLVLLDIEDNGKVDLSVIEKLRAKGYKQPIVIFTNHTERASVIQSLKLGITDYICKADNMDVFVEKLRIYIDCYEKEYFISNQTKFHPASGSLNFRDECILISRKHRELLTILCENMHHYVCNDDISVYLFGKDKPTQHYYIRRYISQLRGILSFDPSIIIKNEFGNGYFLTSLNLHNDNDETTYCNT